MEIHMGSPPTEIGSQHPFSVQSPRELELGVKAEDMARYRRIALESSLSGPEVDEAILLVGRIIQNAIDRLHNKDAVQFAQKFNKKSCFQSDSSDASLAKARSIGAPDCKSDMRLEP